jgi:hypothetical protein
MKVSSPAGTAERNYAPLASCFVAPPFAANPARLQEHQDQGQVAVHAAVAMPAAYRILQQQKPLYILDTKTG